MCVCVCGVIVGVPWYVGFFMVTGLMGLCMLIFPVMCVHNLSLYVCKEKCLCVCLLLHVCIVDTEEVILCLDVMYLKANF